MATQTKFHAFIADLGLAKHNLDTDDIKVALSNVAPVQATNTVLSDITQIAATGGYTAGGYSLANPAYSQTSGVGKLTADDLTVTAAGGSIGPFRYAVIYNNTHASKPLISFVDRGSSLTLNDGESWLFDINATNGLMQIS